MLRVIIIQRNKKIATPNFEMCFEFYRIFKQKKRIFANYNWIIRKNSLEIKNIQLFWKCVQVTFAGIINPSNYAA